MGDDEHATAAVHDTEDRAGPWSKRQTVRRVFDTITTPSEIRHGTADPLARKQKTRFSRYRIVVQAHPTHDQRRQTKLPNRHRRTLLCTSSGPSKQTRALRSDRFRRQWYTDQHLRHTTNSFLPRPTKTFRLGIPDRRHPGAHSRLRLHR